MCRYRRDLSNAYLLATFGFDTAENEPCKVCPIDEFAGDPDRGQRASRKDADVDGRGTERTGDETPARIAEVHGRGSDERS